MSKDAMLLIVCEDVGNTCRRTRYLSYVLLIGDAGEDCLWTRIRSFGFPCLDFICFSTVWSRPLYLFYYVLLFSWWRHYGVVMMSFDLCSSVMFVRILLISTNGDEGTTQIGLFLLRSTLFCFLDFKALEMLLFISRGGEDFMYLRRRIFPLTRSDFLFSLSEKQNRDGYTIYLAVTYET